MGMLPRLPYSDGIRQTRQTIFGGYNHRRSASDGELYDMTNMSSDEFPLLSPRKKRYTEDNALGYFLGITIVNGIKYTCTEQDGIAFFYKNGTKIIGTSSDSTSLRQFVVMNNYLIVLPDMKYYEIEGDDPDRVLVSMNIIKNVSNAVFKDGTYMREPAKANTLTVGSTVTASFRVDDAVEIGGCTVMPENNKTAIIREISGGDLIFYEDTFTLPDGETSVTEASITVSRTVPVLDFALVQSNRLWGCSGNMIYASKQGDPLNFNVFDGLATDSYQLPVASAGSFTGCVSYLGYPTFFKEDKIYKIYGSKPTNYQLIDSATLGVENGSHRSLAIAGEVLFYKSRAGIVAYSGGIPQIISDNFGDVKYTDGIGGSDGVKYYVSLKEDTTYHPRSLFVYDTSVKIWVREDDIVPTYMATDNGMLYCACFNGKIITMNSRDGNEYNAVSSMCEFGDFYDGMANKKHIAKILLRVELEENATLAIDIKFDSSATWETVTSLMATVKKSFYLPIIPRRTDHFRLRLRGTGMWRLYSLAREISGGSPN